MMTAILKQIYQWVKDLGIPLKNSLTLGFTANVPHTEESNMEEDRVSFIGDCCGKCAGQYNRCWCNTSDLSKDLVEIENNNDTNISGPNLEGELTSQTSFKQPPPGWSEFRKKVICKNNTLPVEPKSNDDLNVKKL